MTAFGARKNPILLSLLGLLFLIPGFPIAASSPSIQVSSPAAGTTFYEKTINVTGTASGSDVWWNHTAAADFNGTCDGTVISSNNGGEISLVGPYDDFNDNSIDANKWTTITSYGFSVSETSEELEISGSATNSPWIAKGALMSTTTGIDDFSADVKVASFSGSGHGAFIELYQDNSNYFYFGYLYDSSTGTTPDEWAYGELNSGSGSWGVLDTAGSGWHKLRMTYDEVQGEVDMYVDSNLLGSQWISLSDWDIALFASTRATGDSIDARFDNIVLGSSGAGNYTSAVLDSRMSSPNIKSINWAENAPSGTSATVFLRSSTASDMVNPTAWSQLINGQTSFSGLSPKRYLQYRVALYSTSISLTPLFQSISIHLFKDIVKVEVSPTQGNWRLANGTTSWSIALTLIDGARTIYCKATDAAGDSDIKTVQVMVDYVPAQGVLKINGDDEYAGEPSVQINLSYSGPYQVTYMQVSNTQDFSMVEWQAYVESFQWNLSDGDGAKTVYARLRDFYGLVSDVCSSSITLDTSPPTGSIHIETDSPVISSARVTLLLNVTDESGVNAMQLSNSPDLNSTGWIPFEQTTGWDLAPGPGLKIVYARFIDTAGHISAVMSDSIIVSGEGGPAPNASMMIGNGAGFCRDQNTTLFFSITNGSAAWMSMTNYDIANGGTWQPFANSLCWTLVPGDGKKVVSARFATATGVLFSCSQEIILDTIRPRGTLSINNGDADCASPAVTMHITADDANGVSLMRISNYPSLDDTGWEPFASDKAWVLLPENGTKAVYLYLKDPAGWLSDQIVGTIRLHNGPVPTGHVSINNGKRYARSVYVNLTLWLDDFSLAHGAIMKISNLENFSDAAWEPFTTTKNWILSSGDGEKFIYALFELDKVTSPSVQTSIILDTIPPAMPIFDPYSNKTYNSSIQLSGVVEPGALLLFNNQTIPVHSNGRFIGIISLVKGPNIIQIFLADPAGNSNVTTVLIVKESRIRTGSAPPYPLFLAIILIIVIATAIAGFYSIGRGHGTVRTIPPEGEAGLARSPASDETLPGKEEAPVREGPNANEPHGRITLHGAVNVDDLDDEEELLAEPPPVPPPEAVPRPVGPSAKFSEMEVMKTLSSLPRGLPSTLWGLDIEELASEVSRGEYRVNEEGELIVKIGSHWYYGNPKNIGTYMQKYKGK